jgi:hypothetical protein
MGVYIPNMEKPKECGDCNFVQAFWDDKRWLFRCLVTDKIADDCPLIEIPTPHGRLGDLDVLLEESLKEGAYNYIDSWQIAEQPTILEAEE